MFPQNKENTGQAFNCTDGEVIIFLALYETNSCGFALMQGLALPLLTSYHPSTPLGLPLLGTVHITGEVVKGSAQLLYTHELCDDQVTILLLLPLFEPEDHSSLDIKILI